MKGGGDNGKPWLPSSATSRWPFVAGPGRVSEQQEDGGKNNNNANNNSKQVQAIPIRYPFN